jgi:CSLREA domain-containing protein
MRQLSVKVPKLYAQRFNSFLDVFAFWSFLMSTQPVFAHCIAKTIQVRALLAALVFGPVLAAAQSLTIGNASGLSGSAAVPVPLPVIFSNSAPGPDAIRDIDSRLTYDASKLTIEVASNLRGNCRVLSPGTILIAVNDNGTAVPAGVICNLTFISIAPSATTGSTPLTLANGSGSGCASSIDAVPCGYGSGSVAIFASTVMVTKTQDSNDGVCNADCSLREALASAQNGILINFATPLFSTPQTITLSGSALSVNNSLAIQGPGANLLSISGNNASRVFNIASGISVSLSGMTISGGNAVSGGGIVNNGVLTLSDSAITGNSADSGGGILHAAGTLTVIRSSISGNTANTTLGSSGGIDSSAALNVADSTISGNSAPNGNNSGGGILSKASANITNSTITNNLAAGVASASGIYRDNATVTLANCIVAANQNSMVQADVVSSGNAGAFVSNGFNLIGNRGAILFTATSDQSGTSVALLNPLIAALTNNGGSTPTHALIAGSSALDKGKNFLGVQDQRGLLRTVDLAGISAAIGGDSTDIGAFEAQSLPVFLDPIFKNGFE